MDKPSSSVASFIETSIRANDHGQIREVDGVGALEKVVCGVVHKRGLD